MTSADEKLRLFYESLGDADRLLLDGVDETTDADRLPPGLRAKFVAFGNQLSDHERAEIIARADGDVEGFVAIGTDAPGQWQRMNFLRNHGIQSWVVRPGQGVHGGVVVTPKHHYGND